MGKEVIVQTPNHIADIEVAKGHDVVVKPRNYILSSASCASILDGTVVPDWLSESIAGMVASGIDGITKTVNALDNFTRQLETGVTQQINAVQTEAESKYQLLTQDVARLDNDMAALVTLAESKVDSNGATALFTSLLTAQFNDVNSDANAWIVNQTQALSNAVSANANSLTLLTADYNGLAVSVQTLDQVQAGMFSEWDGITAPKIGQFKLVGNAYYQFLGGTLGENADGWVRTDKSAADIATVAETYAANASKLITDPDGNITGWEFGDGSNTRSVFKIHADQFQVANSATGHIPFSILNDNIVFNGLVTFGSNQTGTIDEAISAVVQTVAVGDKNINITDNLIPTTSLVADTDNSGYQFIGNPTKSNTSGIDAFAEAQIVLGLTDEVYSPFVDDITVSYYYRYGVKGITDLTDFTIVTINDNVLDATDTATYHPVTMTLEAGQSLVATEWYIVEGIINPLGGNTDPTGVIRDVNGTKIATINNFVLPADAKVMLLGWYGESTISRMKLAKISADTITNSYATLDYAETNYVRPEAVADAVNNNTTTIDGSKITTGSIFADKINTTGLYAENILADVIDGKTINGSVINGAIINGAIIKGAYIDLSDTTYLTNWQFVTDINTIPIEYRGNFAKHEDGTYIIDGNGYYRLPTARTISIPPYSYNVTPKYNDLLKHNEAGSDINILPYNAYQEQTLNRLLSLSPTFLVSNMNFKFQVQHYANQRTQQYFKFKVLGDMYEIFTDSVGMTTMSDLNGYSISQYIKKNGVDIGSMSEQRVLGDLTISITGGYVNAYYTFGIASAWVTFTFGATSDNKTIANFIGNGKLFEFIEYWSQNITLKNGYGATISIQQSRPEILVDNGG